MRRLLAALSLSLIAVPAVAAPKLGPKTSPQLRLVRDAVGHKGAFVDVARAAVVARAAEFGFDKGAVDHLVVDAVHDTGRGGVVVAFRHVERDVVVWRDAVKVLLTRDGRALSISGQLHAAVSDVRFDIDEAAAVFAAVGDVGKDAGVVVVDKEADGAGYHKAHLTGLKLKTLRVQPVLAPIVGYDVVVPGYVVEFSGVVDGERVARSVVVNAADGAILTRTNLIHDAAFTYRVYADTDGDKRPTDGPIGDLMPYPAEAPDGHYPGFVPANLVTIDGFNIHNDPWLGDADTKTVGNNVNAAADTDIDGVGDLPAVLTSAGTFDHQTDIGIDALANDTQKMASATTLFFLVNWLHDWFYDSGFDEAGRNAQQNNFGRGGAGNDRINAIAQYGAPDVRDNSAMAVLDEGESPEMEMFIWSGRLVSAVTYGGDTIGGFVAEFGPQAFDISGEAVVVDDGAAPDADACSAIVNDVAGKVAVIDRGVCSFSAKVLAADTAGAVGVIIVNNNPGEGAPFMPIDPNVAESDLPVLSLSLEDGRDLKDAIAAGAVVVDLDRVTDPDRDGAFDTSVAAHEWGHYLHLRQVACGSPQCGAQSEGWGDFVALLTLVREGDDVDGAYPVGSFAVGAFPDDPAYFGIRRYPYSANLAKNPLTFRHIADNQRLPNTAPVAVSNAQVNNAETHAAGEIWATMMFEATMALLDEAQQPGSTRDFEATRRYVTDIVVKGMQVAPQDPTYTDMRDAVIAAAVSFDDENGRSDAFTIADAFARRGAGTCAVSPERYDDVYDAVVEDFGVQGNVEVVSIELDDDAAACDDDAVLDAGESGNVTITVTNKSPQPSPAATVTLTSTPDLSFVDTTFETGALAPFETVTLTTTATLSKTAPRQKHIPINAKVTAGDACDEDGLTIAPLTNADDIATGLTVESAEGSVSTMTLDGRFAEFLWFVAPSDEFAIPGADWGEGNHYWFGADAPLRTDAALVTPELQVGRGEDFVIHFRHRYSFEFDADANYDGAVIEISRDGGQNFDDVNDFGDAGYTGLIGVPGNNDNRIGGRDGYVGQNDGYPDLEERVIDLGDEFAGEDVIVRFRIGTDRGVGADGWELDDIGFDGLDNAPFAGVINNVLVCEGVDPGEGEGEEGEGEDLGDLRLSGGGCHCSSTSQAEIGGLALLVIALRRRRTRR